MSQVHPIVEDICSIVIRLQQDKLIEDDHPDLYHLCSQLEDLLQIDRKEKTTFFGTPKSFWDYFCQALVSKRSQPHEGIVFVKGIQEVKTSEGKGRVFIRFCLTSRCFADTLQQCLLNQQVTNDWFGPHSPLQQSHQSQVLIHSLYDLSDVYFELGPPNGQLDTQWPQPASSPSMCCSHSSMPLAIDNASTSCEEAAAFPELDSSEVPGWPPPRDFVQITAGNPLETSPRNQFLPSIETNMSESIPELLVFESKHTEFLKFILGKIVGLKTKLDRFAVLTQRIPDCPQDVHLVTEDFREDLELLQTATYGALSDLEVPIPKIENPVPDVAITAALERVESLLEPTGSPKEETLEQLQQQLLDCESRCQKLEERNKWMKEAVSAANMVVAQEIQKVDRLRSQLDCLRQNDGETRPSGAKDVNQEQLELLSDKLRKVLTLVTLQQDQIGALQLRLDASQKENETLVLQMDKLQKVLQKVETNTCRRNRYQLQVATSEAEESEVITCQESQLPTESETQEVAIATEVMDQPPSIATVSKTLTRLHSFIQEKLELEQELESAKEMTSSLMSKVAEQEQKLSNVTLELSDTRTFVAKLQAAFSKLQTNDSILRYELREKRRIFNALKQQLEGSRAEWKQIQQKNTVSMHEWQSLRDEFASRHKQASQESGFGEESGQTVDEEAKEQSGHCSEEERSTEGATAGHPDILVDINRSASENADKKGLDMDALDARGRRLKLLEEQCRLLCKKLVKSAVHCAKLDSKLTSLHDQYGSPGKEDSMGQNPSPPEPSSPLSDDGTTPIFESSTVGESVIIVEDMLDSLLTNITEVHPPVICIDPQGETVRVSNLSSSLDRFGHSENEDANIDESVTPRITHYPKPSAFVLAHALPKRVEKLKQEKEEMQQVLRTIRNERAVQEQRENMLLAQIDELQNTQVAKHTESNAVIERLQVQLQQMSGQLQEESRSKLQLQEEMRQVIFCREERIEQMTAEIQKLQIENQKLKT